MLGWRGLGDGEGCEQNQGPDAAEGQFVEAHNLSPVVPVSRMLECQADQSSVWAIVRVPCVDQQSLEPTMCLLGECFQCTTCLRNEKLTIDGTTGVNVMNSLYNPTLVLHVLVAVLGLGSNRVDSYRGRGRSQIETPSGRVTALVWPFAVLVGISAS
jgi:hypothetical protein